ncbi:MAG TPA: hypothetical protein VFB78_04335 [Acidimicrobiales bacterium]|nr:hypothetical protein [Acidimicrobiales bacterium]
MRLRGRVWGRAAALGIGAVVWSLGVGHAGAAQPSSPGCALLVNGQPLEHGASPDDAVRVDVRDDLALAGAAGSEGAVTVALRLGPARVGIYNGTSAGDAWTATVDVGRYAIFGVGRYQVVVHAPDCETTVWVNLVGRSPWTTIPGAAAALVAVGGLALLATAIRSAKPGGGGGGRAFLGGALFGLAANVISQQHGGGQLTTKSMLGFTGVPGGAGFVAQKLMARFRGGGGATADPAGSGGSAAPSAPSAAAEASSAPAPPTAATTTRSAARVADDEPTDELRFIQAQVSGPDGAARPRFPSGACTVAVRVGPSDAAWLSSPDVFPSHRLSGDEDWHTLTVTLSEPTVAPKPLVGELRLPRHGASDPCRFAVEVPPDLASLRFRVTMIHDNRVLQSAVIEGTTDAMPDGDAIKVTTDAVVRTDIGDLKNRGKFGAAVVVDKTAGGDTQVMAVAGANAQLLSLEGMNEVVKLIEERLTAVASSPEAQTSPDSPAMTDLMRFLAVQGALLRDSLIGDQVAEASLLDQEKLQVVSVHPEAFVPIEFIYDRPAPALDAPICEGAAKALADGSCPSTCPTGQDAPFPVVCPLSFWCMQRVIERHASSPERVQAIRGHADLAINAEPGTGRRSLDALKGGLIAFHERVDRAKPGTSAAVIDALRSVTETPPVVAATWAEWTQAVATGHPTLLVLLSHTVEEESTHQAGLAIGADDALYCAYLDEQHVAAEGSSPPIVLLLGCDTALNDVQYENFVNAFHRKGAAMIVGTTATVLGYHAAAVAAALVGALHAAVVDDQVGSTFGDVLRAARRELVGKGYAMALALTAYGDADWRLAEPH